MKILTVGLTQRFNLGNYEHVEVKLEAGLDEGESAETAISKLKEVASRGVYNPSDKGPVAMADKIIESVQQNAQVAEVVKEAPKAGKGKAKAAPAKEVELVKHEAPAVEAEVVKEKAKPSKVIKYSNTDEAQKKIFAAYLAKTYGDTWKTKAGLKDFSASLNGVLFIDADGNVLESFKGRVAEFFGEAGVL